MKSLLSETSDTELMRQENSEIQNKYKGKQKGETSLDVIIKHKRMYPENSREIEVSAECDECTKQLNQCPCKKRDKHQFDIEMAINFANACHFENQDPSKAWLLEKLTGAIFQSSKGFNFVDFTQVMTRELDK